MRGGVSEATLKRKKQSSPSLRSSCRPVRADAALPLIAATTQITALRDARSRISPEELVEEGLYSCLRIISGGERGSSGGG
jgi:hypothetical protein